MSFTGFPTNRMPLSKREKQMITDEFLTTPCLRCGDKYHSCSDCPNEDILSSGRLFGELKKPEKRQTANNLIKTLQHQFNRNRNDPALRKARENRIAQEKAMGIVQPPAPVQTPELKPQTGAGPQAPSIVPTASQKSPDDVKPIQGGTAHSAQPSSGTGPGIDSNTFDYKFPCDQSEGAVQKLPTADNLRRQPVDLIRQKPDLRKLRNAKLDYPARDSFAMYDKRVTVLTNHFQLIYKNDKPIVFYEFRINELENKAKRKARAMMESIIANCDVLSNNRASFATDYFCTIVAWVDLRTLFNQKNSDGTYHLLNIRDGPLKLRMNLRFERQVDMQDLLRYAKMDPMSTADSTDYLEIMTNMFNIVISECAEQSPIGTIPGGGNKFYRKDAHADIRSFSLCIHRGYSYSVKAGVGSVLLNVNTLTSAFWRPVNFVHVIRDDDTWLGVDFANAIVGLRVYINYNRGNEKEDSEAYRRLNSEQGRTKTIIGLGKNAYAQTFQKDGQQITVAAHFASINHNLQWPKLPVVNLGKKYEPIWYPAEKLNVLAYQKYKGLVPSKFIPKIQDIACQRPPVTKALVALEGLETLGVDRTRNSDFDLPSCSMFSLRPFLLKVDGGVLPPPSICYKNEPKLSSAGGRWNFARNEFYQCKYRQFSALVLRETHVDQGLAKGIANNLATWSRRNYKVAEVNIVRHLDVNINDQGAMDSRLQGNLQHSNMAVLIPTRKNISAYSTFKDLCDRKYGLHAICLTEQKCQNLDQGQLWGNIMLKMNLKASGINHTVSGEIINPHKPFMKSALILGADVTHPGPGSVPGCPSIAAIVGSVDSVAGRFLGSMRLQRVSRAEIIDEVEDMVRERLVDWIEEMTPQKAIQKTLPQTIVYYRDGVSESMYAEVKKVELKAIRDAFRAVVNDYTRDKKIKPSGARTPKIIAIICGKRHHIRFYPANDYEADVNQNCRPGTTVDNVVTSPYYQDFYLQSHSALKGTARPAHYFVIENEPNESVQRLRTMTHELCYTYVRAPVGVSYAAPAYYADRLCERGRCYLRDYFVTPKDSAVRRDYDYEKSQHDKLLKSARDARSDAKERPKTRALVEREAKDVVELREHCDKYIMGKARKAFEEYNQGGNPWHSRVSKTMFWM